MYLCSRQNRSWDHHHCDWIRGIVRQVVQNDGTHCKYLAPLRAYTKSTGDSTLVEGCFVNIYTDLLMFFRSAQRVFVDVQSNTRKWTLWRVFWRVLWVPFQGESGRVQAKMPHYRDVLNHATQAPNLVKSFDVSRNEQARCQRELGRELG